MLRVRLVVSESIDDQEAEILDVVLLKHAAVGRLFARCLP